MFNAKLFSEFLLAKGFKILKPAACYEIQAKDRLLTLSYQISNNPCLIRGDRIGFGSEMRNKLQKVFCKSPSQKPFQQCNLVYESDHILKNFEEPLNS